MATKEISLKDLTQYYSILGLSFTATKEQVRRARNKLMMQFHPDRHPKGWVADDLSLEDRVQRIQESYQFIINNYDVIEAQFEFMHAGLLSSRTPHQAKSHWVYSEISKTKT
jgi:preprotein translocase subunit Sec63